MSQDIADIRPIAAGSRIEHQLQQEVSVPGEHAHGEASDEQHDLRAPLYCAPL